MTTSCTLDDGYLIHHVTPLDNLIGLSVKYQISVHAIRRLNPFLVLGHQIPPTTKTLKIPNNNTARSEARVETKPAEDLAGETAPEDELVENAQNCEVDPVEELKQSDANAQYFAVKGLMQRFASSERDVQMILQLNEGNLEKAREALREQKKIEKVALFAEKVKGECTLEEAEHWLAVYKWDVFQAVHFFKKHLKKQKPKNGWFF